MWDEDFPCSFLVAKSEGAEPQIIKGTSQQKQDVNGN